MAVSIGENKIARAYASLNLQRNLFNEGRSNIRGCSNATCGNSWDYQYHHKYDNNLASDDFDSWNYKIVTMPAIRIGVPAPAVAKVMIPPEINTIMTIIIIIIIIGLNITVQLYRTGYSTEW